MGLFIHLITKNANNVIIVVLLVVAYLKIIVCNVYNPIIEFIILKHLLVIVFWDILKFPILLFAKHVILFDNNAYIIQIYVYLVTQNIIDISLKIHVYVVKDIMRILL